MKFLCDLFILRWSLSEARLKLCMWQPKSQQLETTPVNCAPTVTQEHNIKSNQRKCLHCPCKASKEGT